MLKSEQFAYLQDVSMLRIENYKLIFSSTSTDWENTKKKVLKRLSFMEKKQ